MKIAVLGGNGYLGRAVTLLLHQAGHDVAAVDNFMFDPAQIGETIFNRRRVKTRFADLRLVEGCRSAIQDQEVVVYCAGISGNAACVDTDLATQCNVTALEVLVRQLNNYPADEPPLLIYVEALDRYLLDPDDPMQSGPYFWTQHRGTVAVRDNLRRRIILRLPNLFGGYEGARWRFDVPVNQMVARAVVEGSLLSLTDSPKIPHLHVVDAGFAVKLVVTGIDRGLVEDSGEYDVGSAEMMLTIAEVAQTVQQVVGGELKISDLPWGGGRPTKDPLFKTFTELCKFKPGIPLRRGVEEVAKFVKTSVGESWTDPGFHNDKLMRRFI